MAMLHLMVHYMRQEGAPEGQPCRVLLSAHTNAAVDRVLLGLLDSGCSGVCSDLAGMQMQCLSADGHVPAQTF